MNFTSEQHESLEFLRQTMRWYYWPYCAVKKGDQVASCFDEEKDKRTVYLVNLFSLAEKPELLKTAEKIEYPSSAAMVQDGWTVD